MGSSRRRALSFQTSSSKDVGVDGLTNDLSKESHGTSQFDSQIVWVNTVCSHTMPDFTQPRDTVERDPVHEGHSTTQKHAYVPCVDDATAPRDGDVVHADASVVVRDDRARHS